MWLLNTEKEKKNVNNHNTLNKLENITKKTNYYYL